MAGDKMLSDRAKLRLRLAARLLRTNGKKLDFPRDQFYEKIQEVINSLPDEIRAQLKENVDFVERYEREEATNPIARTSPERVR
jgi:hypothetical protein